ncbi:hypothetical protein [Pyrobaculum aerophilum]|uniref:Uncharacterized protein n=1 Tax=Pyrobaculum aerophilum TaxID=13773 RepID=A0A371QVD9_9CREN|nr:hypothetical protein [Pyrobaculum aerophilum]RFA94162.1 hypothetical protein CGL51_11115 [Pyrobaculum aerophilum]RFA99420.1 hypothetical protein CGL52_03400 [Pyrobaculum aerophilum]
MSNKIKRFFLFFLPTLVFLIALTSPGGEYVFRWGPLAHVEQGALPPYAVFKDSVLYLYSSPYSAWRYEKALKVELLFPTELYIGGTCGFIPPSLLTPPPGVKWIDITVPPMYEGTCLLNITHPSGWHYAITIHVKLVDWYPSSERSVVVLRGVGWQFVQVGEDGVLYVWERPLASVPVVGCAAVWNRSLLLAESLPYSPAEPYVKPAPWLPSAQGVRRYGFFIFLNGTGVLYIHKAPCPVNASITPRGEPSLRGFIIGPFVNLGEGYKPDAPLFSTRSMATALRRIVIANGTAHLYTLYSYWYTTPVDIWGGVMYFKFTSMPMLTFDMVYIQPANASHPEEIAKGVWVFNTTPRVWVSGSEPPAQRGLSMPRGTPLGWQAPFYVVIDPTDKWGGWPEVIEIRREELQPAPSS